MAADAGRAGFDRLAPAGVGRLAAVAGAFLPDAAPSGATVFVAAPGVGDTGAVCAALLAARAQRRCQDLGGSIGRRLERWERDGPFTDGRGEHSLLLWCPVAREAMALTGALVLGRLAALLRPRAVTVLWFGERTRGAGRPPTEVQRGRAIALARAAVPPAAVHLHHLGWQAEEEVDLLELARRFA